MGLAPEFEDLTEAEVQSLTWDGTQLVRDVIAGRIGNKQTVLDIGCGYGLDALRYTKEQYTGVDISAAMIAEAKRRYPAYRFMHLDAFSLPFDNTTFEVAMIKSVLEHLHSQDEAVLALEEALSVATTIYVAWHTPPITVATPLIRQVPGHCGKTVYQNTYSLDAFPKPNKIELIDNFTLWTYA